MELNDAINALNIFKIKLKKERPYNFMPSYEDTYKSVEKFYDGYIFHFQYGGPGKNPEIIVVLSNYACEIYGAMAKLFLGSLERKSDGFGNISLESQLGNPVTGERWIGSGPGRYQLFERGIIKWEGAMNEDIAHQVVHGFNQYNVIETAGIVAFADIRGFTKWVASVNDKDKIHQLVFGLEEVLQRHFARHEFKSLFLKGVGDGFMIVYEEPQAYNLTPDAFITACKYCCQEMGIILQRHKLNVGFGIDIGELKNVLILGRWDYIGEAVNNASKLQNNAKGSLVISDACYNKINDATIKNSFSMTNTSHICQLQ